MIVCEDMEALVPSVYLLRVHTGYEICIPNILYYLYSFKIRVKIILFLKSGDVSCFLKSNNQAKINWDTTGQKQNFVFIIKDVSKQLVYIHSVI